MLSLPSYFFVVQEYEYLHSKLYTIFCFRIETFSLLKGQSQKRIVLFAIFEQHISADQIYFWVPDSKKLANYGEIFTAGRLSLRGDYHSGEIIRLRGDYHCGKIISAAGRLSQWGEY